MEIILQGNKITSKADFHLEISNLLQFPEYYGANLDALWDCLTAWVDLPLTITWIDFEICKQKIGEYADTILSVFRDFENETANFKIVIK